MQYKTTQTFVNENETIVTTWACDGENEVIIARTVVDPKTGLPHDRAPRVAVRELPADDGSFDWNA